jgi:plastocyanin
MQLPQVLARASLLFAGATYAAVVSIDVGENGLVMDPKSVTASVGDVIQFAFYPPVSLITRPWGFCCLE